MEDRLKAIEKRMEILEAGDARWQGLVDKQLSALTKIMLDNITQMKTWLKDLQEHFESHGLDKKKREEYAFKRKTNRYNKYTP